MTEKLSLTELQLIIRDSLYMALPDFYWVIGEISEIKENFSGHCYLELIEKNPEEQNIRARIKAIIWSKRHRFLKSFFENITGERLREGLKILVKVKIEYSELYGLSLIICDIDPAFTLGEMAMKRQAVIKKLQQEGIFLMNRELKFPLLPQKIAVISSCKAAGYTDFINHLLGNSQGYVYYPALFETPMQGLEMEQGIINALDKIAAKANLFDLVVIIRGGGSQADLSWFDSYNIAYHVTQFPLPVVTGIGHDKDESVTDMVANKSLKTPTAVADYLIGCTIEAEKLLLDLQSNIIEGYNFITDKYRNSLELLRARLIPSVRLQISDIKEELSGKILRITDIGKEYIVRAGLTPANLKSRLINSMRNYISLKQSDLKRSRHDLAIFASGTIKGNRLRMEGLESFLEIVKPENVLRRGYTITSANGKILKSKKLFKPGDIIETQFIDGKVKSKVLENPQELKLDI